MGHLPLILLILLILSTPSLLRSFCRAVHASDGHDSRLRSRSRTSLITPTYAHAHAYTHLTLLLHLGFHIHIFLVVQPVPCVSDIVLPLDTSPGCHPRTSSSFLLSTTWSLCYNTVNRRRPQRPRPRSKASFPEDPPFKTPPSSIDLANHALSKQPVDRRADPHPQPTTMSFR